MAELRAVYPADNMIQTSIGKIDYDYLVLACGTTTNFFGNKNIEEAAIPMKTVTEAMGLRNSLLSSYERSVTCSSEKERDELLNIVIVGGGPSGVEIAGAIAEMRRYVLPLMIFLLYRYLSNFLLILALLNKNYYLIRIMKW